MYFCQDEYIRTFYPYLAVTHLCEFEYQEFISILIEMDACLEVWKLTNYFQYFSFPKTVVFYAVPRLEGGHGVWDEVGVYDRRLHHGRPVLAGRNGRAGRRRDGRTGRSGTG